MSGNRTAIRALPAVLALALLAAPASAGAAVQTTTIEDDSLAPGTAIAQYPSSNPEIRFGTPVEYGFATGNPGDGVVAYQACGGAPVVEAVSATHSPPNAEEMALCGPQEFPFHGDFAVLTETAEQVSAYVGNPAHAGATFELDAYDVARKLIRSERVTTAEPGMKTKLALTTPNGEYTIAFVAIYEVSGGNDQQSIGMDDLSVQWGEGKPSISLASSLRSARLAQSAHAQFQVSLIRHNHSNGEVQLNATGLPSGVHASFGEDPLMGTNSSTPLTITVDDNAPLASSSGSITAEPKTPAAGKGTEAVPIAIQVVAAFGVFVGSGERVEQPSSTAVALPPCSSVAVPVTTILGEGFEGSPIDLGLATAGDKSDIGSVTLPSRTLTNPTQFGLVGAFEQALTVTSNEVADPHGSPLEVSITPTSGPFTEPTATVEVEKANPQISYMYNYALAPEFHHAGSEVTIKGTGFCPGSKVTFGNSGATVSPDFVNSDGTELRAVTPMLATTGPVRVESAGRTATSPEPLNVQSFRDTWGFSWENENYGMQINERMIEEIFGYEETHESLEHTVTWRKPNAWAYEELTNKFIGKGICFGMAFSSLELRNLPHLATEEGFPGTGGYPWALTGPTRPSEPLLRFVIENFSLQFTDQLIPVEVHAVDSIHSTNEDIEAIESGLNEGEPVMIGLIEWKKGSILPSLEAHTVLAYDTRQLGGGSVEVRLYNPNTPFKTGERTNAKEHEEAELTNSQLIMKDGHWTFPEKGWSGSEADMVVYRHSELPIINGEFPKLPGLTTLAKVLLGMGSAGDAVTQVSDGHGALFSHGQLAPQSSWPAGVAPVPDFTSQPSPLQLIALDPKSSRPVTATVTRASGGGSMSMFLPGLQAILQAGARQGQVDHVTVDPHTDAIGYRTSAAHTPLGGTLISAPGASSALHIPGKPGAHQSALGDRIVHFHMASASGGSQQLSFLQGRELVLRHSGAPTTISLQLSAFTAHGQPVAVQLPAVRVASGATVRVQPRDWHALGATTIRITTSAHGHTARRLLRGRGLARRFASVRRAQLGPVQRGLAHLDLALALHHPPAGASVLVSATVSQHGHVISKPPPAALRGGALTAGNVALALPTPLRAGRYHVHVRLLEISSSGAIQASITVAHTVGLTVS